jgi:hypothetical protein
MSSHEALTGSKPNVMDILPFGCRTYVVQPRRLDGFSGTDEAPSWLGITLGQHHAPAGMYHVWIPPLGRVVTSPTVYFDEGYYPWRPAGDQRVPIAQLQPPPPYDRAALPGMTTDTKLAADALSLPKALDRATTAGVVTSELSSSRELYSSALRRAPAPAYRSRKMLILYSGSYRRPDGVASTLIGQGYEVLLVDNDPEEGDSLDDILDDDFYSKLLARASAGEFLAILAAPPCSTFSAARSFVAQGSTDTGPPPVRSRSHPEGLPNPPPGYERELAQANLLVLRTLAIISAATFSGSQYILEHPADHVDPAQPGYFK